MIIILGAISGNPSKLLDETRFPLGVASNMEEAEELAPKLRRAWESKNDQAVIDVTIWARDGSGNYRLRAAFCA